MKIDKIDVAHYRIPLPKALTDSTHGTMTYFELVTVRITDSDEGEGLGYTYTVNHGGAAVRALIEMELVPLIRGYDSHCIAAIWEKMWWALHYVGRGGPVSFAISAVDIALWDLNARRQNLPLWKMLGGHNASVLAYAGGIDLYLTLEELLEQTDNNLANGFRAIKMKVGRDQLSEDVSRLATMREHLGTDFPLMVDANMRWSRDEALHACFALAEYSPYWLEEPLIPEDDTGHSMLANISKIPIAAGENLHTIYEFQRMIALGAVSFPEPDVSNCGGITTWMKIAALAECHNLKVTSHGVHDLHVHLLAAVSNKSYLEVHGFGLERYIEHPLVIENGLAQAPDRPGHGVSFDWESLRQHQV